MLETLLANVTVPLLKGLGLGFIALVLFFFGKDKGKDELTIKSQKKDLKNAKEAQVLKAHINSKPDDELISSLSDPADK